MSGISQLQGPKFLLHRQSPPSHKPAESAGSTEGACPGDQVQLSSTASAKESGNGFLRTALLAGLAAVSVASALAPGVADACLEHVGAPFEMLRDTDGKVVFYTGIGNEVVEPLAPTHKEVPGAALESLSKRGETVCEQAVRLGGICDNEDAASIPTPYGSLIVEQNSDHSLDIYSNDGGHVGMKREAGGVDVRSENGDAFFHNNGHIDYR
jgi:hypothetical protein